MLIVLAFSIGTWDLIRAEFYHVMKLKAPHGAPYKNTRSSVIIFVILGVKKLLMWKNIVIYSELMVYDLIWVEEITI